MAHFYLKFLFTPLYGLYRKTYGVIVAIPNEKIELINKVKVDDFVNVEGICIGTVKQANPTVISIQIKDPKINQ